MVKRLLNGLVNIVIFQQARATLQMNPVQRDYREHASENGFHACKNHWCTPDMPQHDACRQAYSSGAHIRTHLVIPREPRC